MSGVVPIKRKQLPAVPAPETAAAMPAWKSDGLDQRLAVFRPLLRALEDGASDAAAVEIWMSITGKGRATGYRWMAKWRSGGIAALAPEYKGRPRTVRKWDVRAQHLLTLPSRPNCGDVAARLRAEGFGEVTAEQVRALWKSLPSNLAETSKKRLGEHHYRLNETPYVIRDWSHVPVGYLYELDGHTCDFYVEHPITGGYFRPELTVIIDVRSRYIVDFWVGGFENSTDLRWALSRAFLQWDHVCHEIHVDPGAFRAKSMVDPFSGWCTKLDVDVHFALPGNARGKGLIEGEYHIFEGRFGKFMPTYLHNRTDDEMRLFADKWKKRLVPRYTVGQLCQLIQRDYVDPRRHEPRKSLDGASPAELWAQLQPNPVMAPATVVCRPRKQATVQNGRVRIHNRRYQLDLHYRPQYENRAVLVEYDDFHDQKTWIYDVRGNYVCTAQLLDKQPGIPESRVCEKLARTAAGQRKRLELKLAEVDGRARGSISAVDALHMLGNPAAPTAIEHDTTAHLLHAGHTFGQPALPPPALDLQLPPVDLAELAHVRETLAVRVPDTDTSTQRYTRYLALRARAADGDALSRTETDWLVAYSDSAECAGLTDVYESFGYLPGATK